MSLYGALFAGVAGLNAQANKIGVISDNIANVNTVGYKSTSTQFESLVVNTGVSSSYSPGGVLANNRTNIDKQGLLLATDAPTDIALSGGGFFVVSDNAQGTDAPVFTRAGSFRTDATGNFVNAAGYYLQGWPLDANGDIPITSANLDSLETINVDSASGTASATGIVSIGANLDATESILPGESATAGMDIESTINFGISADDIIVPAEYSLATTNSITRLDQMVIETGNGIDVSYEYGGFAIGRSVTTNGSGNIGDGQVDNTVLANLAGGEIAATDGSSLITFTLANHGLVDGDSVTLSGVTATGSLIENIPIAEFNATHTVTRIDANTFAFNTTTAANFAASGADGTTNLATGTLDARQFSGNIFNATTVNEAFIDGSTINDFTAASQTFTITTSSAGTSTFTYVSSSPNTVSGEFNTLTSLATAIDEVSGLTARISGGRLVVGAEDANEAVSFANGDNTGTSTLKGLDWVTELDLADVGSSTRRFSTLQALSDLVNADAGLTASVTNPLSNTSLSIRVDDPLDTISFSDYAQIPLTRLTVDSITSAGGASVPGETIDVTVSDNNHGFVVGQSVALTGIAAFDNFTDAELNATHVITQVLDADTYVVEIVNAAGGGGAPVAGGGAAIDRQSVNNGSLLAELGLVASLEDTAYVQQQTGGLGPRYDATGGAGENMASGDITPQFSRSIRIFDALGTPHDMQMSFVKVDQNSWATEIYAVPASEVNSTLADGQVASGTIVFNGDGTLRSVSAGLANPVTINWTNGAVASEVVFDLGTAGLPEGTENADSFGDSNGLSQFSSDYNVNFVDQNGSQVGDLIGVSIDSGGIVSVSFSNGDVSALYKLPIADFSNPNGLNPASGNVFTQTRDSGEVNLRQAGSNGTGDVVSGVLESSNVELSEQLTDLIVAQRAYQSNTKAITTSDELLEELNRL